MIVISRKDGGISLVVETNNFEKMLSSWKEIQVQKYGDDNYVSSFEIDSKEIPWENYLFRDVWEIKEGRIEVQLDRCKTLLKQKRKRIFTLSKNASVEDLNTDLSRIDAFTNLYDLRSMWETLIEVTTNK